MSDRNYPTALPPPEAGLSLIDHELLAAANAASRKSPRKRISQPLHKHAGDRLQRMINSLQPGTYIRPRRHASDRAESLVVLAGSIVYVTFDDEGRVRERLRLAAGSDRVGVDTEGGIYHCFAALEPDTVLFEVKLGPHDPETDKEFASWAPEEGTDGAEVYLEGLLQ